VLHNNYPHTSLQELHSNAHEQMLEWMLHYYSPTIVYKLLNCHLKTYMQWREAVLECGGHGKMRAPSNPSIPTQPCDGPVQVMGRARNEIADPEIQSTNARFDDKAGSEGFDDNLQAANKALANLTAWAKIEKLIASAVVE
jgi:hypothetical protein